MQENQNYVTWIETAIQSTQKQQTFTANIATDAKQNLILQIMNKKDYLDKK